MLRCWCIVVSYVLGIRSYLLGDDPDEEDATTEETAKEEVVTDTEVEEVGD